LNFTIFGGARRNNLLSLFMGWSSLHQIISNLHLTIIWKFCFALNDLKPRFIKAYTPLSHCATSSFGSSNEGFAHCATGLQCRYLRSLQDLLCCSLIIFHLLLCFLLCILFLSSSKNTQFQIWKFIIHMPLLDMTIWKLNWTNKMTF